MLPERGINNRIKSGEVRIKKKERRKSERDRSRETQGIRDRDGDSKREFSQCNVCLSLVKRWRMPCPLPQREKPVLSLERSSWLTLWLPRSSRTWKVTNSQEAEAVVMETLVWAEWHETSSEIISQTNSVLIFEAHLQARSLSNRQAGRAMLLQKAVKRRTRPECRRSPDK